MLAVKVVSYYALGRMVEERPSQRNWQRRFVSSRAKISQERLLMWIFFAAAYGQLSVLVKSSIIEIYDF